MIYDSEIQQQHPKRKSNTNDIVTFEHVGNEDMNSTTKKMRPLLKEDIESSSSSTSSASTSPSSSSLSTSMTEMTKTTTALTMATRNELACEFCSSCFASATNLKQHVDAFHAKTTLWRCSECNRVFTSKSNLKVHLRVHTRVKPYHCKSCAYSCMHHSSIKEHLAKVHPSVVHSASHPAYVFNSVAVPDPVYFNSAEFDRDAFIAEARQANEKLAAQINTTTNTNTSTATVQHQTTGVSTSTTTTMTTMRRRSSVSISPISNHSSPNASLVNENEANTTTTTTTTATTTVNNSNNQTVSIKPSTDFSISSLIGTSSTLKTPGSNMNKPQQHYFNGPSPQQAPQPAAALLAYTAQMQLFYSYLSRFANARTQSPI